MKLLTAIAAKLFKSPTQVVEDLEHAERAQKDTQLATRIDKVQPVGPLVTAKRDAIVAVVADPEYKRSTTASRREAQTQLDNSRSTGSGLGQHNRAARRFAQSAYGQKCIQLERLRQLIGLNPNALPS